MRVNDHRYRSMHKFKRNGCINNKNTLSTLLGVNRSLYYRMHKSVHIENTIVQIENTQGCCIILCLCNCWRNREVVVDELNEWVRRLSIISHIPYKKRLVILPTKKLPKHISNLAEYKTYNQLLSCYNCSWCKRCF